MSMQRTFVIIKPDAVQRGLTGEILARFERKGLRLAGLKLVRADAALAERHYAEHRGKPFFPALTAFITGGPLVAAALTGDEAVAVARTLIGATDGRAAAPGTIRGDFALSRSNNLVHGSDSAASAERELALWFPEGLVGSVRCDTAWAETP
jgi:nucleoside-diphosphate kinase